MAGCFLYKDRIRADQRGPFADIIHARDLLNKGRGCKLPRHRFQFRGGIEPDGDSLFFTEGQQAFLVFFQINGSGGLNRPEIQAVLFENLCNRPFDGFLFRAPAAADAGVQNLGNQPQGIFKGFFVRYRQINAQVPGFSRNHPVWQGSHKGKVAF